MAAASAPYVAWVTTTSQQAGASGQSGARGGGGLRSRLRCHRAACRGGGQPRPAGDAGGDQLLRAEHAGHRRHRSVPTPRCGRRRRRDVRLRRIGLVGGEPHAVRSATTDHDVHGQSGQAPRRRSLGTPSTSADRLSQLMSALPQQLQDSLRRRHNASAADTPASSIVTAVQRLQHPRPDRSFHRYQFTYATFQTGQFIQGLAQSRTQAKICPRWQPRWEAPRRPPNGCTTRAFRAGARRRRPGGTDRRHVRPAELGSGDSRRQAQRLSRCGRRDRFPGAPAVGETASPYGPVESADHGAASTTPDLGVAVATPSSG